jgi:hypothetical protein
LIFGSHPGQGLQGRRLDNVERRDVLWLGAETEAEPEATSRASMLIGQDPPGCSEQPRQGNVRLRQAIDPPPRDGKGLGHRVLSVGLAGRTAEGKRQDSAVMSLEGIFEAAQV